MSRFLTTFSSQDALTKARGLINKLDLPHEVISPAPGFNMVGVPAVVLPQESRSAFIQHGGDRIINAGCKQCGEKTCLAFALYLYSGKAVPSQCWEIFVGKFGYLKDALLETCGGMGVEDSQH
jgi:hypothetical protein